jgi:hypothetical protein
MPKLPTLHDASVPEYIDVQEASMMEAMKARMPILSRGVLQTAKTSFFWFHLSGGLQASLDPAEYPPKPPEYNAAGEVRSCLWRPVPVSGTRPVRWTQRLTLLMSLQSYFSLKPLTQMVYPPPMSLDEIGTVHRILDEEGKLLTAREADQQVR